MTSFALLGYQESLEKQAGKAGTVKKLLTRGLWPALSEGTAKSTSGLGRAAHRTARVFHNPETGKSTGLAKALGTYGFAGEFSPMLGVSLPGSGLAFGATMPGMSAMFSAPNVIRSWRMRSPENKAKLKADTMAGAQQAAQDVITTSYTDPKTAYKPNYYRNLMDENGYSSPDLERYEKGGIKPMGWWSKTKSVLSDSQKIIDNETDLRIQNMLHKKGSIEKQAGKLSALGKAWSGVKTWGMPTLMGGAGLYGIGNAVMSDKPYDVRSAQEKGYAAGQIKIQDSINNMSGLQRFATRLDPTLLAGEIDKEMPGTIKAWENSTGYKFQPGWLSKIYGNYKKGGTPSYYTYDTAGTRHYT